MANIRNANTFYIDTVAADQAATTTGNLPLRNVKLLYVIISGTGATPSITLKDVSTGATKFRLELPNNSTVEFDFSRKPVVFPNGISPSALNNCDVTLVIEESGA